MWCSTRQPAPRTRRSGPGNAQLGRERHPLGWDEPITENPALGATEIWELHNFTADAHPIHIHEVTFEVVNREGITTGAVRAPEPWEAGRKDTVIAYPDEITRVKALFDRARLFVWHCPHRRARGQRDDAPLPRTTSAPIAACSPRCVSAPAR